MVRGGCQVVIVACFVTHYWDSKIRRWVGIRKEGVMVSGIIKRTKKGLPSGMNEREESTRE